MRRATFITTALENGAQLGDVRSAAVHCDPGTTKLCDRLFAPIKSKH
jgi:integrase/recombinase XerD